MGRPHHREQSAKGTARHGHEDQAPWQARNTDRLERMEDGMGGDHDEAPPQASVAPARREPREASPMRVESIRLRNFKVFRNASIGPLQKVCYFIGANGSGKSALFDAFAFLRDCTAHDVRHALDKRGGYRAVRTRDAEGGIRIELRFRMTLSGVRRAGAYTLELGADADDSPYVARETLRLRRGTHSPPCTLIDFRNGRGEAVVGGPDDATADGRPARETHNIAPGTLAIKQLGDSQRSKAAYELMGRIGRWHVSAFHLTAADHNGKAKHGKHLAADGRNLGMVARFLQEKHGSVFEEIRQMMGELVPGITSVDTQTLDDGSVRLLFRESAYKGSFTASQVSDGTIQAFAHLVLLHDPDPHPLLCIEAPESLRYHSLLWELAGDIHDYANRAGGQVMVATHSPDLLNDAHIDEVFWLMKRKGQTRVRKASHNPLLVDLARNGELPGELWATSLFEGAHPHG